MPNSTKPGELAHERKRGRGPTVPGVRARALNGGYPAWLALNPGADEVRGE